MNLVAIDFETYYEDERAPGAPPDCCSIGACKGDYDAYAAHPRFEAYLVAIKDGKNIEYVGPPASAPWSLLHRAIVVAHNAPFDNAVFRQLRRAGVIPSGVQPNGWYCTAYDPAAPKGRRSLADAAKLHLGAELDKAPRAAMAGSRWSDLSEVEQAALKAYCLNDAALSMRLALAGVGVCTASLALTGFPPVKAPEARKSASTAADPVNRPAHYTGHPSGIECIRVTEHMGFNLGNATKYIWRCDLKQDAIQDLEKARWYLDREISKRRAAPANPQ